MKVRIAFGAALAVLVAGLLVGSATGSNTGPGRHGLKDERYCELFFLKGKIPNAYAVVYNTIGLNKCPSKWWDGLDTTKLAQNNGANLVIKNGPRHWLMDFAQGSTGQVVDFDGQQMRRVASIPIRTQADLSTTPYTEREIDRSNIWRWKKGREIYELKSPDGSTYVMQSYSQIIDPNLQMSDLPTLADRLTLPDGWSYVTKKLRRPLTVGAEGRATILQDNLKNTYQKLPPKTRQKAVAKRKKYKVKLTGATKAVGFPGPNMVEDRGTVSGKPFGDGTIDAVVTFDNPNKKITGTYTIEAKKGTITGTLAADYVISNGEIDFQGTATMKSGTGKYKGIVGRKLTFHDHNTFPDGQNGVIEMSGFARY